MIRPGIKRTFRLALGRRDLVARDVDEEIALHLELRTCQLVAQGMTRQAADREARRRFGEMPVARRRLRSTATHREVAMQVREWFEGWAQDLRYVVRGLRHEPLFTTFVVTTLALGIGANAAMYGIVNRLLLSGPSHVRDAKHVMRVYVTQQVAGYGTYTVPITAYAMYAHLKAAAHDFDGVGAETVSEGMLGRGAEARPIQVGSATWDLFPMLGASAYRGRFISAADDDPENPRHAAVLGYGLWQRDFGGSGDAIGRQVVVNNQTYTVIGVAPRGFTGTGLEPVDVWTPMSLIHPVPDWRTSWNAQWLEVYARLKPGVSIDAAGRDATMAHRATYTGTDTALATARLFVAPLSADLSGGTSGDTTVWEWLLGVTFAVLLIACASVINLQLARAIRRRRELAVRAAMGAGRGRLVRLLFTEGLTLGLAGATAGLAVAFAIARVVRVTLLSGIDWPSAPVDTHVLASALAMAGAVGIVVGLVPAVRAMQLDLTADLKAGSREGGGRRSRLRTTLTVGQAALATMLLVGAGLFVRSVQRARGVDLGLQPDRVLTAQIAIRGPYSYPASEQAAELARQRVLYRDAVERLRALPGVANASVTIGLPFQYRFSVSLRLPGRDSIPRLPGAGRNPSIAAVGDGYFETVGTKLLAGRVFTPGDREGTERVTIVNQTMAKTLWPGQQALGQCLIVGDPHDATCTRVVGIVQDTHRSGLSESPAMQYYVPFGQESGFGGTTLLIRPMGSPAALADPVRRLLAALVPSAPYVRTDVLEDAVAPQYATWDLGASVLSACGVLALIVAAIGLYSVMSYLVVQRRHELGVRAALGAGAGQLLRLVLGGALAVSATGIVLGIAGAAIAARWLQPLLFQTSARDPLVYSGVTLMLLAVALASSLGPGLRAGRVDPLDALRVE